MIDVATMLPIILMLMAFVSMVFVLTWQQISINKREAERTYKRGEDLRDEIRQLQREVTSLKYKIK